MSNLSVEQDTLGPTCLIRAGHVGILDISLNGECCAAPDKVSLGTLTNLSTYRMIHMAFQNVHCRDPPGFGLRASHGSDDSTDIRRLAYSF